MYFVFFFFCSWLLLCILVCFVCVALISLRCAYTPFIPLSLSFLLCNLSVRNVELFYPFLLCVFEGSNLNTVFFFLAEPICFLFCTEYYGSFSQYGKAEYCSISLLTFESPVAFFFFSPYVGASLYYLFSLRMYLC